MAASFASPVAGVEGGVHDTGGDEDRVAGAEEALLAVEPLLDLAGDDDDHLLLVGVLVEVVALAGVEGDVDDGEVLGAGGGRVGEPAELAPVEDFRGDVGADDELAGHGGSPSADGLEGAGLFGERPLDRQALHRGGAVEAVAGARRA